MDFYSETSASTFPAYSDHGDKYLMTSSIILASSTLQKLLKKRLHIAFCFNRLMAFYSTTNKLITSPGTRRWSVGLKYT